MALHLNLSNLSEENLLVAETVALGAASKLCAHYGRTVEEFRAARPDLWRPEIPAADFRHFLATGE